MDNQKQTPEQILQRTIDNLFNKILFDIEAGYYETLDDVKRQIDGYCSRIRLVGLSYDKDFVNDKVESFMARTPELERAFSVAWLQEKLENVTNQFSHIPNEISVALDVLKEDIDEQNYDSLKEDYHRLAENVTDNMIATYCSGLSEQKKAVVEDQLNHFKSDLDSWSDVVDATTLHAEKEKVKSETKKESVFQKIKGFFVAPVVSPYDGQEVTIQNENIELEEEEEKTLWQKLQDKLNEHPKVKKVVCGAALITLLGATGYGIKKAIASSPEPTIAQQDDVSMITEFATYDDQELQTKNVYALTAKLMQAGYDVTPEQVDDWYIMMNLQGMDSKTYAKLMANSNTDIARMFEHFNEINVSVSDYYSKNVEQSLDIYQYILNEEDQAKMKETEEAIMESKAGNKTHLKDLIMSRVTNPVAASSHGATELSIIGLFYQQTDVYNASVIGQDVMDLYNAALACTQKSDTVQKEKTTFVSTASAELHDTMNQKEQARLTFEGTEKAAYDAYIAMLPDSQNDNKVYVEQMVKEQIKANGIVVANSVQEKVNTVTNNVKKQVKGIFKGTTKATTTVKTQVKAPTTEAEKKVQKEFEQQQAQKAKEDVKKIVEDYAKTQSPNATVTKDQNNNYVIKVPGQQDTIVKEDGSKFDNVEMLDPSKEGKEWFKDYDSYKKANENKVEYVQGEGGRVVTEEKTTLLPGFHFEGNKIIQDSTGDMVLHGTDFETVNSVTEEKNSKYESTDGWHIIDEGNVTVVPVENEKMTVDTSKPSDGNNIQNNNDQNSNRNQNNNNQSNNNSNNDLQTSLTPEEQKELEEILNAGKDPKPNEIVSEESITSIGGYAINDLLNNPSLCQNIPESTLKQYPEIWQAYQNWLKSQQLVQTEAKQMNNAGLSTASVDNSDKIRALEEAKAEVVTLAAAQSSMLDDVQVENTTGSAVKVK